MESNVVATIVEIVIIMGGLAALIFFLDRKQSARMDRLEKRIDDSNADLRQDMRDMQSRFDDSNAELRQDMRDSNAELRQDMRDLQSGMQALNSKVDRMQGTLDILVFGSQQVPPPVAQTRAETERQIEEALDN